MSLPNTLLSKLSGLISNSELLAEQLRLQNYWTANRQLRDITQLLNQAFSDINEIFAPDVISNLLACIENITHAQASTDYVLLGDYIELNLIPSLYEMQGLLLANFEITPENYFEKNLELYEKYHVCSSELLKKIRQWNDQFDNRPDAKNYNVEFTNCGYLTLSRTVDSKTFYLHSNKNPWLESLSLAKQEIKPDIFNYTVIGLGFCWLPMALLIKDDRITVTVLENDINIIGLMTRYYEFGYPFDSGRIQILYTMDYANLSEYTDDRTKLVIHHPSLTSMKPSRSKNALEKYFLHESSLREQKQSLDVNFYFNQKRQDKPFDVCKDSFTGKTAIYLGGGPSAESKLPMIREYLSKNPDTITICAGKVYRTLLDAGFIPDYVIITDAKAGLVWQTQNIPENKARLLYLATASRTAVDAFQGNRYIIYQEGYDDSEKFAKEHGYLQIATGGSVSTAAIDLLAKLGCKKVITTGLDLAYPAGKTHAFGITADISGDTDSLMATDIYGNPVQTSFVFQTYREWIERRLQEIKDVEFINVTDGVKIKGMENCEKL